MALNYTLHHAPDGGNASEAVPSLPVAGGQYGLAAATPSTAITGPVEIRLMPDEDQRVDVRSVAGDLTPASSPLKIKAGIDSGFKLPRGTWYLAWAAA